MKKIVALSIGLFSIVTTHKTCTQIKEEQEMVCNEGECQGFTKLTIPTEQMLVSSHQKIAAGETVWLAIHCKGKPPFKVQWMDGMTQITKDAHVTRSFESAELQETTLFSAVIRDADGNKITTNEVTIKVPSDEPSLDEMEALINMQHFAKEYESLSDEQKEALQQEPSYMSTLFYDSFALLFEKLPLEDALLTLIDTCPFLLDWYEKWLELTGSQPESLDTPYEPLAEDAESATIDDQEQKEEL